MAEVFPSPAWCERALTGLNDDADFRAAAQGWQGDLGLVIDRPEGPLAIHVGEPVAGQLPPPRFVEVEALERAAPRYFARASQHDWWALIDGTLDPIAALVQKRLVARGDLSQVAARLQYGGLAKRWLASLR